MWLLTCERTLTIELHISIEVPRAKQREGVFAWRWHYCIKVKIAIVICRDYAVVAFEEFANLHLRERTVGERSQSSLKFLVLMVLDCYRSIIRCCGCALRFWPKVNIVKATFWFPACNMIAELTLASLRIVIVEDIKASIPRCTNQVICLSFCVVLFVLVNCLPVDQACNVLVDLLCFISPITRLLGRSTVIWLPKSLLFDSIFDVKAVSTPSLVTNVEFTLSLIQAHAGQISRTHVTEDIH